MNRIEIAAGSNTQSIEPLRISAPFMPVSCTPTLVVATIVGAATAASALYAAYLARGFNSGIPDSAGEITEDDMQVSDLISARRTSVGGIV